MSVSLAPLLAAVQSNCHLSDARHAQELTLCTYLLAMREYYRWEHDLPPEAAAPRADVSRWIAEREALWDSLAQSEWSKVPLAGGEADPFDVDAVNAELVPAGYLYGAGRGRFGKPHFFLARLARRERRDGVEILEAGCEYVRDLDAAPAMLQGETIVLRREAFERWLWLRAETWETRAAEDDMAAALEAYGYRRERGAALERMAEAERETLILHELGELAAGRLLGEVWERFMDDLDDRRVEITARAVRDLLADTLVTLPTLIERDAIASLHFWFATFSGLRRELFPRLPGRPGGVECGRGRGNAARRRRFGPPSLAARRAGHRRRFARRPALRARARRDHARLSAAGRAEVSVSALAVGLRQPGHLATLLGRAQREEVVERFRIAPRKDFLQSLHHVAEVGRVAVFAILVAKVVHDLPVILGERDPVRHRDHLHGLLAEVRFLEIAVRVRFLLDATDHMSHVFPCRLSGRPASGPFGNACHCRR